jgi:saccharopine dehydrogenase-like NADP-dependent oxidoreductase
MDAVILGACGAVGREVSSRLATEPGIDRLMLVDLDVDGLRRLARRLDGRVGIRRADASDRGELREVVRGAGVLVNCTTYRLGVPALRAAIAERVDYVDLGGLYNTPRQLELDERARRAGIRAVIGCGATPGLSNVLVRRAADLLDRVEEVHISFASHRDMAASPGLLDTLLDEFRPGVPRFTWRDGRLREVEPFDGARRVRFAPPVGLQDVYFVPHSETYTLPRSLGAGLREVSVRGTWRPSDMRALGTLARLGLTSDRPLRVDGVLVRPLDVLRAVLLSDPPAEPGAPCAFFLDIEVKGRRGDETVVVRHRTSHPMEWGVSATGQMTAVPAAVATGMLASGKVRGTGVLPPERAFEPGPFLRAVRRAGVRVTTSTRAEDG